LLLTNVSLYPSQLSVLSLLLKRETEAGVLTNSFALLESSDDLENKVAIPPSQLDSLVSSTSQEYGSYEAVPVSQRSQYRKRAIRNTLFSLLGKFRRLQPLVILVPGKVVLHLVESMELSPSEGVVGGVVSDGRVIKKNRDPSILPYQFPQAPSHRENQEEIQRSTFLQVEQSGYLPPALFFVKLSSLFVS